MIITALATPSIPEKDHSPNEETELSKAKEPDFEPYRVFPFGSPVLLLFLVFSLPLWWPETRKNNSEKILQGRLGHLGVTPTGHWSHGTSK